MAVYLDENMMAADPAVIGFPHILLCMGVVCMTDTDLYGIHLTSVANATQAIPAFGNWLTGTHAVAGGAIRALYGTANLKVRYGTGGDKKAQWKAEMKSIATAIGFAGKAYGFDTSIIDPVDGTYAEYHAQHAAHKCKIFYKRNEKMAFTVRKGTDPAGLPAIQKVTVGSSTPARVRRDGTVDPAIVVPTTVATVTQAATVGADVVATTANKGQLHEVNYGLRLMSVDCP